MKIQKMHLGGMSKDKKEQAKLGFDAVKTYLEKQGKEKLLMSDAVNIDQNTVYGTITDQQWNFLWDFTPCDHKDKQQTRGFVISDAPKNRQKWLKNVMGITEVQQRLISPDCSNEQLKIQKEGESVQKTLSHLIKHGRRPRMVVLVDFLEKETHIQVFSLLYF